MIIADEPLAALDVSIRAQIISLFRELIRKLDLTMIFITHDISVIPDVCGKIAVMYGGRIVEYGTVNLIKDEKFIHPYSKMLMSSILSIDKIAEGKLSLTQKTSDIVNHNLSRNGYACNYWQGCKLYQSSNSMETCITQFPHLESITDEHSVACHYKKEL